MRVLLRGITVGAVVGLALGYKHSDGFDRERIARLWETGTEFRFGHATQPWEPLDVAVWIAILGGAFGAGCVGAAHILPAPPAVAGAVYGVGVWWGIEHWYSRISSGRERWGFPPPQKTAGVLAAYGAAVAVSLRMGRVRRR